MRTQHLLRLVHTFVLALIITVELIGCTTISEQSRMTRFKKISERYKELVLLSEFETAYMFGDTENMNEDINTIGGNIARFRTKIMLNPSETFVVNFWITSRYSKNFVSLIQK